MTASWAPVTIAVAQALTFIATFDIIPPSAVPKITRLTLALLLVPLLRFSAIARDTGPLTPSILHACLSGLTLGLSASIVAAAARAAGSMVDNMLGGGFYGQPQMAEAGPFHTLYNLGFVVVFVKSGAFAASIALLGDMHWAAGQLGHHAALIAETFVRCALQISGPALGVQAAAMLLVGFAARVVPHLNGMLLGAPVASLLILLMFVSAGGGWWTGLSWLAVQVVAKTAQVAR